MVVESKKNGEILQWDDILLHTFPIILKDIYMIRYLLKAENQHFLSDSHHSCQAIPFSSAFFSLKSVRSPIFLSRPHLLIYWQKNINVASIWGQIICN